MAVTEMSMHNWGHVYEVMNRSLVYHYIYPEILHYPDLVVYTRLMSIFYLTAIIKKTPCQFSFGTDD